MTSADYVNYALAFLIASGGAIVLVLGILVLIERFHGRLK